MAVGALNLVETRGCATRGQKELCVRVGEAEIEYKYFFFVTGTESASL